jgi:sec-independent protein translocase protein TatB
MDIIGIGGTEFLVIMLFAVIILGPERLTRVAREAGKLIRNLKAYLSTLHDELLSELDILDDIKEVKRDIDNPF